MNCLEFANLTKMECTPIRTRLGEDALFVALPATFIDGEPLPMYVVGGNAQVQLTDGGDTLFHLHSVGFKILDDKRRWSSLRDSVEQFGARLNDKGEIEVWTPSVSLNEGVARYCASLMAAAAWEIEHFGQPLDGAALIEEVKEYLLVLRPDAEVKENISVTGVSGKTYNFPISMDGVLVDAMSPSAQSSNSMVRRLVDIRAVPSQLDLQVEIAVDDRDQGERSEQDIRLLEILATPLRMSRISEQWREKTSLH